MRYLCLGALGLCLAWAGLAGAAPQHVVVVRAATLIDGAGARPLHDQEVLIRGDRIAAVYARGAQPAPDGAQVLDLGDATLLPGLIDCHTHIFLQGEVPEAGGYDVQLLKYPASYRVARAIVAARRALEQGFTTIRDVETEGAGYGDVGIQRAINEGIIPGPRMFVATRAISSTGGYQLEGYAPEITVPKGAQLIDGPVEARKAAREQLDHGADWIKVYMTHRSWVDEQGALVSQPTLTVEELRAIVDEAHGWRRKVACHAYNGIGLQRALDGGCDSIEHGLELSDAQIQQMIRQGTWYVPTLAVYYYDPDPPETPSRQARPAARRRARRVIPQGTARRREDRLRHRRRRFRLVRSHRPGIRPHGRVRHDPHAGDPGGHHARGRAARQAQRARRRGARRLRGPHGGTRRSAAGRRSAEGRAFRHEGRRRVPPGRRLTRAAASRRWVRCGRRRS